MSDHKLPRVGDEIQGMCVDTAQLYDGTIVQVMGQLDPPDGYLYRLAGTGKLTASGAQISPIVQARHLYGPVTTSPLDQLDLADARAHVRARVGDQTTSFRSRWYLARATRDVADDHNGRAFTAGERILAMLPRGGWSPEPYDYVHAFSNDLGTSVIIGRYDMVFETIDLRDDAEKSAMVGRTYRMALHNGVQLSARVLGITERGDLIVSNTVDHTQTIVSPYSIVDLIREGN